MFDTTEEFPKESAKFLVAVMSSDPIGNNSSCRSMITYWLNILIVKEAQQSHSLACRVWYNCTSLSVPQYKEDVSKNYNIILVFLLPG